jgi:hypothetical protein
VVKEIENHYTNIFGCGLGQYPFRYLGIPMHHMKISYDVWKVIRKIELLEREVIIIQGQVGLDKFSAK